METKEQKFKIIYNQRVAEVLTEIQSSIAVSTYQAGKVLFIGSVDAKTIHQIPVSFKKPMGIALYEKKMAVATLDEIQIFANSEHLAKNYPYSEERFDALFLPRATYYSGETDLHDLSFGAGGIWAVNTRFSCISTYDTNYSFVPRWMPPFVKELTPEDKCHLNGMAMIDSKPAYATALGQTNDQKGWRENIVSGGVLMKVPSGEIVLENLAMPHSPRMIDGELYLLLSASGEVVKVDVENNKYDVITKIPAFIRGMSSYKHYMFVGLSKVRKSSKTFSKLPVADMSDHAGIAVIDLRSGEIIGQIKYESTVEEIFDVQVLPEIIKPGLMNINDERHKSAVSVKNKSFWKG